MSKISFITEVFDTLIEYIPKELLFIIIEYISSSLYIKNINDINILLDQKYKILFNMKFNISFNHDNLLKLPFKHIDIYDNNILQNIHKKYISTLYLSYIHNWSLNDSIRYNNINIISEFTNIIDLKLCIRYNINLNFLRNLKKLKMLDLNIFVNKPIDISIFREINIDTLKLSSCNSLDYSPINDIKSLKYLAINDLKINDLSFINKLVHINEIYIGDCNIYSLNGISNLSKIEYFTCYMCKYLTDISEISKLINLYELDLSSSFSLINIDSLHYLKKLQFLNLNKCSLINNILSISNLNLKYLNLIGCHSLYDIKILPSSLKILLLNNTNITDLNFLNNLSNINYLDLSNCVKIYDFKSLSCLDSLNYLNLFNTNFNDTKIISELKIQELYINNCKYIQSFKYLKNMISLNILSINFNDIEDISFLKSLTSLKILFINNNKINDFNPIKKLINLEKLYISSNKLPIDNLNFIISLKKIYYLDISNNIIKDNTATLSLKYIDIIL